MAEETEVSKLTALYRRFEEGSREKSRQVESFRSVLAQNGELPPRKVWPDELLDPKLNGVSEELDELCAGLKQVPPGKLSSGELAAWRRYLAAEGELLDALERMERHECLMETRTREQDLWAYMTRTSGIQRFDQRLHEAKVDNKIQELKRCYYENRRVFYNVISERLAGGKRQGGARGRAREREPVKIMARVEKKLDLVVKEEAEHCWDALRNKVRRLQVNKVWLRVKELRAQGRAVHLHAECERLYREADMVGEVASGGYPNYHALYKFCRAHELEF